VALGESIVAIGVGMAGMPLSWPVVVAAVLGLLVAAAQWWMYFDVTSLFAERALAAVPEADRARLARDAYSFLHLPMIAGVVFLALGMKKVLEYVGDSVNHAPSDPLAGIALYALFGGAALYLLGHAAFKLRTTGHTTPQRIVACAVLLALLPFASRMPALGSLALLALVMALVVAYETRHFSDERTEIRHGGHDHDAAEAAG
jgi:low temperature requirement protein LtrA